MIVTLAISAVCTAFQRPTIGTRVRGQPDAVLWRISRALEVHDSSQDRVPGQHFLVLPPDTVDLVKSGVGKRTLYPQDYVLREHRGRLDLYLSRAHSAPAEKVAAVVYTAAAYATDPQATEIPGELDRLRAAGATHVVVAILAFAGPAAPVGPWRFVVNAAGGNNEYALKTADELRAEAKSIETYYSEWCVVAD